MNSQFYDPKASFSQSYLLSRIVRNAQRPKKIPFFIRENWLNTLRWSERFSVNLKSLVLRFPFPLREKVRVRGFVRAIHPHPCPLPQAGEGSDLILTLSQSARLLIFSLSERDEN